MANSYFRGVSAGSPSGSVVFAGAPSESSIRVGRGGLPPFRPFNVANAFFQGDGTLSATLYIKANVAANFTSAGVLLGGPRIIARVNAPFSGAGTLDPGNAVPVAQAEFLANPVLSAVAHEGRATQPSFMGLGVLSAAVSVV